MDALRLQRVRGSVKKQRTIRPLDTKTCRRAAMSVLLLAFLGAGRAKAFVHSPVPRAAPRLAVARAAVETLPAERPHRQAPLEPRLARVSSLPQPPLRFPEAGVAAAAAPAAMAPPVAPLAAAAAPVPTKQRPALAPDDDVDDHTYSQRWRAKRMQELLQMPELQSQVVNELLAPDYLQRQRNVLKPEEAFGCIFQLDILTDVAEGLLLKAWADVAKEYKKPPPDLKQVQRSIGMLPENAVMREFRWTQNFAEAKKLVLDFAVVINRLAEEYHAKELPGVRKWLEQLRAQGVECAAVSHLPAAVMQAALASAGLTEFFPATVAAEDNSDRDSTAFLKASLKLGKAPYRCAVFDCRPAGMMQAHEADMRGVCVVGTYPVYELAVADATTRRLDELLVYNIRRLFADRPYDSESSAPQLQPQTMTAPQRKTRTMTRREYRQ